MNTGLRGRRITVGVCGGIAAYKAAELVRLFVKEGAEVQVVMTRAAEQFITKMTLGALAGRPAVSELFDLDEESRIGHIQIADAAELLVIAPATADVLARLAAGLADDLLTTVALATKAPLLLAPSMNVNMWQHPQTQDNIAKLVARGARVVGPDSGELACGWIGSGRLVDPVEIVAAAKSAFGPRDLEGARLLVTAGPTHEAIDPVRFLGNRSSGKMGFALARRAAARGAEVTLIAGPVALGTPAGCERVDVVSAREMESAVTSREADASCVIMAAAVADYRPVQAAERKIKKTSASPASTATASSGSLTLELEENPDILAGLAQRRLARAASRPLLVGFAAETHDLDLEAKAKLARKGCDLLVGNDVTEPGAGFGGDTNRITIYAPDGALDRLPLLSKDDAADRILDRVRALLGTALG